MSVLLQSIRTEKYVDGSEGWTPTPTQALSFEGAIEALHYCGIHHLAHMKILGVFDDARRDFAISLASEHRPGAISD